MLLPRLALFVALGLLVPGISGCGSSSGDSGPKPCDLGFESKDGACTPCPAGTVGKEGGLCVAPRMPSDACGVGFTYDADSGTCKPILPAAECPAGTMPMIGQTECQPVGVQACGAGFVKDGTGGCKAILPAAPCPAGQIAVPGDSACTEVAACGAAPWGDIPVDAATLYVDASYAGAGADGSMAKPFPTIQAAIDLTAGPTNPLIAIAAGTYVEPVSIHKAVRLRGRCPSLVEIRSPSAAQDTITVDSPTAVSVQGVAVTGPAFGFALGAGATTLERVWVHSAANIGIVVRGKATSVTLRRSLVEGNAIAGIALSSGKATIDASVIRDSQPLAGLYGRGIQAQDDAAKHPAEIVVTGSLLERNSDAAIYVFGSKATIDATVVRDTKPTPKTKENGRAIDAEIDPDTKVRAELSVSSSIFERNVDDGIYVNGATALVKNSVVRDTQPQVSNGKGGGGLTVEGGPDPDLMSELTVEDCLLTGNFDVSIFSSGSNLTVTGTIVRDTKAGSLAHASGRGISVQIDSTLLRPSTLIVRRSLVERSIESGIAVFGSAATVESTTVRELLASADGLGRGLDASVDVASGLPASLVVRGVLVDGAVETGVSVIASSATIEGSVIRDTKAMPTVALFGDGVVAMTLVALPTLRASVTVSTSLIAHNARAGVAAFGADLTLRDTLLDCNLTAVDTESAGELAPAASFAGGLCGCGSALGTCIAQSSKLEAPSLPPAH